MLTNQQYKSLVANVNKRIIGSLNNPGDAYFVTTMMLNETLRQVQGEHADAVIERGILWQAIQLISKRHDEFAAMLFHKAQVSS